MQVNDTKIGDAWLRALEDGDTIMSVIESEIRSMMRSVNDGDDEINPSEMVLMKLALGVYRKNLTSY